jgi:pimeloyl-ACP methyl ester carboxylesterase
MASAAALPGRVADALSLATLRGFFALSSRFAPRAAAPLARRLFCTPRGRRRGPARLPALPPSEPITLRYRAETLRGHAWGTGWQRPRVLLAHGWAGHGLQLASFVGPLVEAGFEVMAVDQPAHGASSGRTATLPDFARVIRLAAESFGPLHGVVAHSLGGAAAAFALSRWVDATRAVLIAAPSDPGREVERFARFLWIPERVRAEMQRALEAAEGVGLAELHAAAVAPHVRVPALLVHDLSDRVVPYRAVNDYAAAWRGARVLTTEGLGHHRVLGDPAVIAEVVRFLSR